MVSKVSSHKPTQQTKKKNEANKTNNTQKTNTQQNNVNKANEVNKTNNAQQAKNDSNLTDRERGIRDEIGTNKKADGTSEVTAQQGDKLGNVVNASLDKDNDGKISDAEKAGQDQAVKDILNNNPDIAARAKELGIDPNNLKPEDMDKLMNMDLKAGEKVKLGQTPEEAKAPEEAKGEEAKPEEAKGEEAKPEEAKKGEEAGKEAGKDCGKADGAQKANNDQKGQQATVEQLIAQAAQKIQQAQGGGGAQGGAQSPSAAAGINIANPMAGGTGLQGAGGAQGGGGSPQQLAGEAKQLLQQAKGMLQQQGGAQGGQGAQQPQQAQQNANPFGQTGTGQTNNQQKLDLSQVTEDKIKSMPNDQKLQLIQSLDAQATQIMQGGGQSNNPLANLMNGNNAFGNAAMNGNASALNGMLTQMKPNLPNFGTMAA